jgi:Holliday junction resolvase RusA-like endonuclease
VREQIRFTVPGIAVAKGSKRVVPIRRAGAPKGAPPARHVAIEQPNVVSFELRVEQIAAIAARRQNLVAPWDGPVAVELVFAMARPRSHYGSGRNAERVRDGAPEHPATKPDVDKLARTILDGITGAIITDDARVIRLHAQKTYGWPAETHVAIWRL